MIGNRLASCSDGFLRNIIPLQMSTLLHGCRCTLKKILLFLVLLQVAHLLHSAADGQAPDLADHKVAALPQKINYHGWPDSYVLGNGAVEVVVVPAIGRVMQFRLAGTDGVFFENRALDGKAPDPVSAEWGNFGGDKSWPSPQADWEKVTKRSWPPPVAFDSMPVEARVQGRGLELVSAVDPAYGIRERRRIELAVDAPRMTITTSYVKERGDPVKVGVWVITQMSEPERAFIVLPSNSQFRSGYTRLEGALPANLKVEDGLLSLVRDMKDSAKIGTDGGTLLWMNSQYVLRIDSPRVEGGDYPDQGSSAEIYTNKDPLAYIELETLGPLSTMKVGDHIERTNTYTLLQRTSGDAMTEARRIAGQK